MPRPSKRSAQAQSQRLAGSKSFGTVQMTGSDTGSVYSSENEDEDSSDGENDITALQSLYTSILPENLKFDQVKSKKWNRPARYNGDSWTTAWWRQKKWKKASGGCEKMDSYFQRIQLMRTGEVYAATLPWRARSCMYVLAQIPLWAQCDWDVMGVCKISQVFVPGIEIPF